MPKSAEIRYSQKWWCNKPTKLHIQSFLTQKLSYFNFDALKNATNQPKSTV